MYLSKKNIKKKIIFIAIFSLPESSNGEHAIPKDKPSEILAGDAKLHNIYSNLI